MKVYFTASARGRKNFKENYQRIYELIEKLGHKNLDNLVFKVDPEDFYKGDHGDQFNLFKKAIGLIRESEVIVLEVSKHSFSMGYVLDKALELGKPVIALYKTDYDPFFALGINNDKLQVLEYSDRNLKSVLEMAFSYVSEQVDTRFNFFISRKLLRYLDWISKKRRIPRAVYLRQLIKREMNKNREFRVE